MSGYVPCKCRDCVEIAIAGSGEASAYCNGCALAGCPDYQGVKGMSQECQADGAYGGDGEDDDSTEADAQEEDSDR